ncbi:MAG: LytTR family transcriptional regulator [Oscillospiraceae bacterium]|nr:LytTR family transcriptional regulator [Oscillospiraceae bacterium]
MKIRLDVSDALAEELRDRLEEAGFEIDDDAELILSRKSFSAAFLRGRDEDGQSVHVAVEEIVYVESMGHDVWVHTDAGERWRCGDRLWQIEKSLSPAEFLRVSNSAIVRRDKIRRIRSALSQKFLLTLSDGTAVDVTRSYYYAFKEAMGI